MFVKRGEQVNHITFSRGCEHILSEGSFLVQLAVWNFVAWRLCGNASPAKTQRTQRSTAYIGGDAKHEKADGMQVIV